ncbi:tryptophan synthase subunit alpha [Alphaproteobacteria bacterium]|nr:tryptophan synthase subunit alpha [Alphaproteobacteria bacterium]
MSSRIKKIFEDNSKKLVTFVTGGDPDYKTSNEILDKIIEKGADVIEIGMPFSDPMADGPIIQLASKRAIDNGTNLETIFKICNHIREKDLSIPIVLMGYYNVILHYGIKNFVDKINSIGVDGLIIVDLQPEEDQELYDTLKSKNIDLIRLITPNTTAKRLSTITNQASGFLYYVTITGITGQKNADIKELKKIIPNIRKYSQLPIIAGFGIKNKKDVSEICKTADGAVVGSSIVKIIENNLNNKEKMMNEISSFIEELKKGTK